MIDFSVHPVALPPTLSLFSYEENESASVSFSTALPISDLCSNPSSLSYVLWCGTIRCVGGQACPGRLYFDFPFVCMCVCVYVPARAHFFMHSVACMCPVINETFFCSSERGRRRGTRESPHASKHTPSPSFFLRHDVRLA